MLAGSLSFCIIGATAIAYADAKVTSAEAQLILSNAELKFQPPPGRWFDETQEALRNEAERVSRAMDAHSKEDAKVWKKHLRWDLLERNLASRQSVSLHELETVRRWMYSNRPGLESPFFALLRQRTDAYLDAVYTSSYDDLEVEFVRHVESARRQCDELIAAPSDAAAAALGRTLGWFQRTQQLPSEVEALTALLSHPNAQIVFNDSLIQRIAAREVPQISETIEITERVIVPPTAAWQRARTLNVRGHARTWGTVQLALVPNNEVAEVALIYEGDINSTARGQTGPAVLDLRTSGNARALRPVYFGPLGLTLGETVVTPDVTTRLANVTAANQIVERIARSRAHQPESLALMNRRARSTAVEQLTERFDERVEEALRKIRAEFTRVQSSLQEFQEVTAPLSREGATPRFAGAQSTTREIQLNAFAQQRGQFGAPASCPLEAIAGDVAVQVHVSCFNNLAETITGGKRLSDEFFMKYAKVIHAELPLPLMVHVRAKRWALTMARYRPIELRIPEPGRLAFAIRADVLEINGQHFTEGATAEVIYRLEKDDLGDYRLVRLGNIELKFDAPRDVRDFLQAKLEAFFGPMLTGGGVVIPEGGLMGVLRHLKSNSIQAEREWIVVGWDVSSELMEAVWKSAGDNIRGEFEE